MTPHPNDLEPSDPLLEAIRQGDARARETLVQELHAYLLAVAKHTLGGQPSHSCDSVVNEGITKAFQHIDQFHGSSTAELKSWLARAVAKEARNRQFGSNQSLLPTGTEDDGFVLENTSPAAVAIEEQSRHASIERSGAQGNTDLNPSTTEFHWPGGLGSQSNLGVGDRIGKFEIREILGRGGQAVTFKAWDPDAQRTVVVKAYYGAPTAGLSEAVLEEGQKLSKVRSPYVVQCFHVERIHGLHCLILEYVPGQTLAQLHKSSPLDISRSLHLIAQVAEGLAAVHARGLLHRDVKPANIVVGHDGVPKLVDFGLAKSLGDPALGEITGTFSYMSPEQARGDADHIGPRTDIFGLGATLYFLLTGHAPYEGAREALYSAAREGNVIPPRQRNTKVPPDINRLCLRCLAKAPEHRFESAQELRKALHRRRSTQLRKVAAMMTCLLAVVVAATIIQRRGRGVDQQGAGLARGESRHEVATQAEEPVTIELAEFQQIVQEVPREVISKDAPYEVRFGDGVRFRAKLSRPAYCYWIAFPPNGGEGEVCFPEDEQQPPTKTDSPSFPAINSDGIYRFGDALGQQVFALLVSEDPLPAYDTWRSKRPPCPWRAVPHFDSNMRFHDGEWERQIPLKGMEVNRSIERLALKSSLEELVKWLQGSNENRNVVQVWALPVLPREPKTTSTNQVTTAERQTTASPQDDEPSKTSLITAVPRDSAIAPETKADRLQESNRLATEGMELLKENKYREAAEKFRVIVATHQEIFGENTRETIQAWDLVAQACEPAEDWESAIAARRKIVEASSALHGPDHYQTVNARRDLALLELTSRLSPSEREALAQSRALNGEAKNFFLDNRAPQARESAEKSLAIRTKILGEEHFLTATSQNNLAMIYRELDEYSAAREQYEKAYKTRKKLFGFDHPETADTLNRLATLCEETGDFARAEELYVQALEVRERILGPLNSLTGVSVNNLANFYRRIGNYGESVRLFHRAVEIYTKVYGPEHTEIATTLNNLADVHRTLGDFATAEKLLIQALEMRRKLLPSERSLHVAISLHDLASLYKAMGDYQRALPLYEEALEIRRRIRGPAHTDTAQSLNSVALVHLDLGNAAKAEELLTQALDIRQSAFGPVHEQVATSLNNLAAVYLQQNAHEKARSLLERALEMRASILGPDHPDTLESRNNLGAVLLEQGEYDRAAQVFEELLKHWISLYGMEHPFTATLHSQLARARAGQRDPQAALTHWRDAVKIHMRHLDRTSIVQGERRQLVAAREMRAELGAYLSQFLANESVDGNPYEEVLNFKGVILKRQRALRATLVQPEVRKTFDTLQRTASQLTNIALKTPDSKEGRRVRNQQLADLSLAKERLESELSQASAQFRQSNTTVTLKQLQDVLPENTALVDLLEFQPSFAPDAPPDSAQDEPRLAAFVVRRGRDVAMLDLGPCKVLDDAVQAWRSSLGTGSAAGQAARLLREKFWEPLQSSLEGVETVLVSPDGALASFPLAALPGEAENTYLIEEERRLVIVPSAVLLPELLAESDTSAPAQLLVVGGVAYDSLGQRDAPVLAENAENVWRSRSVPRGNDIQAFEYLDGSMVELASIEKMFLAFSHGDRTGLTTLSDDSASESSLRKLAPQHRFLHLATHGYFAPESVVTAMQSTAAENSAIPRDDISGFHPGLLSGIALAGANQAETTDGEGDGILSAEEVATLSLENVQLVTLSACETGLGKVAGGEGLLGLQRAFQVAGADSVVASLWKVPDQTTRRLMERFYQNLWLKKMGKLDALREAQLWILREGAASEAPEGEDEQRSKDRIKTPSGPGTPRVSPYYWAGFVLSGDWR